MGMDCIVRRGSLRAWAVLGCLVLTVKAGNLPEQSTTVTPSEAPSAYVPNYAACIYYCDFSYPSNFYGVYPAVARSALNGVKVTAGTVRYESATNGVFFNGVNGGLGADGGDHLKSATEATVMAWVYPMSLNYIRNFIYTIGLNWRYQDGIESSTAIYHPYRYCNLGNSVYHLGDTNRLLLEHWYHMCLTWDGSAMREYVNGQLAWTNATTNSILTIASGMDGWGYRSASTPTYWHGFLDDLGVFARCWSASEVAAHVNGTRHVTPSWTGTSKAELEYTFTSSVSDRYCRVVNTGSFQGHGTRVHLNQELPAYGTNYGVFGSTPFSSQHTPVIPSNETWGVSFWIQPTNIQNNTFIWGVANTKTGPHPALARARFSSGVISFDFSAVDSANIASCSTDSAIPTGRWTHVACVMDPGLMKAYVYTNGWQIGAGVSNSTAGNFDFSKDYVLIGGWPGGSGAAMFLDDWRLHRHCTTNMPLEDFKRGRSE